MKKMLSAILKITLTIVMSFAFLSVSHAVEKSSQSLKKKAALKQGPAIVGDITEVEIESIEYSAEKGGYQLVWSHEIHEPDSSYIAPHFSKFNLPDGAYLIVRSPDNSQLYTYTGRGKNNAAVAGRDIWATHIKGDTAIVELFSSVAVPKKALFLDRYAHGYPKSAQADTESICGTDDLEWAKCYQSSEPTIYSKAKATSRLLINGVGACTGWLVGSEGHLMTNEHCIDSSSDAANTDYEFMAEGSSCSTDCSGWGDCKGTTIATSASLVKASTSLDYALVQLPTNPTSSYGYLQLREKGAELNERIYIAEHPNHKGKLIGVESSTDNGYCRVNSLSANPCSGSGYYDVGYYCDTDGGSSGSAVIGYSDHLVVALHHCGICLNRGVPIELIIDDLGNDIPQNAVSGGGGDCGDTGDYCTENSDCCSGNCRKKKNVCR